MDRVIHRVSPVFGVPNVRQAAEYYRDFLGFELDPHDGVFAPDSQDPSGVYAIVKLGNAWIHFRKAEADDLNLKKPAEGWDLYLYVNDIMAFRDELKRRGAKITCDIKLAPYGIAEIVIEDLNGRGVAFGQPLG